MYSNLIDYSEDLNTKLVDDKKDDNEKHILEKVGKHNDNEPDTNKLNEDNFNDGRSKSTLEKQQEKLKLYVNHCIYIMHMTSFCVSIDYDRSQKVV